MPRVAFYAPLKPPNHPVPSGDREMARNLITAIAAGPAKVDLVSVLRIYDGAGDADTQSRLLALADAESRRLIHDLATDKPQLWVTYHNYYKSPDLIGPTVTRALNIPYVQIETSRAKRRLNGPWARFATAAEAASDAADLIFYLTQLDQQALQRDRPDMQTLAHLRPFLPLASLPECSDKPDAPMLVAAMMRSGDKLASYRIIAETLAQLSTPDWHLNIAGDGPARPQIEALMARFAPRVQFLGQLDRDGMAQAYSAASLFLWPGVNEAYGMVYLEAQAAGLPVVAQDRNGVRDVLLPGNYPHPDAGPKALARQIDTLLGDPAKRTDRGQCGRRMVAEKHLIGAATDSFWSAVKGIRE